MGTFLAEFVRAAPATVRSATQKDMSLHSLENYEVLDVDGKGVPEYMRGIVDQGLRYLVFALGQAMEEKEVVLLRHFVMDQMYALLAYTPPLDADAFAQRGYIITYYDHPLQSSISPEWSDSNENKPRDTKLRFIDPAVFQQRKLAALEWSGAVPVVARTPVVADVIPGDGLGPERLRLAAEVLVRTTPDVGGLDIKALRCEFARLLRMEPRDLEEVRPSQLMRVVLEVADEEDNDQSTNSGYQARVTEPVRAAAGMEAKVKATGRTGVILLHDPTDATLTYKLQFSDGTLPEVDWFPADTVDALGG